LTNAEQSLQQALAGFRDRPNEAAQGQTLLMLANPASAQHDQQKTLAYLGQALTKPLTPPQQVQAHITSAWMHVYAGRLNDQGQADIVKAMRITKMSGVPDRLQYFRAPTARSPPVQPAWHDHLRAVLQRSDESFRGDRHPGQRRGAVPVECNSLPQRKN
ncbi:MAG: hypothetical protein Q9P14_08650, partial [candidate division KSB1 bacterium]|nr:hypothetical protein [candidate division KSB1 bacterium]